VSRHPSTSLNGDQILVLRMLAAGLQQQEIAARLVMSKTGVAARVHRAVLVLGARTTAQAVYLAARRGLLDNVPTPDQRTGS
jgi:DNA-binding NarL/FixJ family response regulator